MAEKAQAAPVSLQKLILTAVYLLLYPALLFFLAGDWYWTEGWVFSVIFCVLSYGCVVYLYFKDPALLKERYGSIYQKGQKLWDKVFLTAFFSLFIVWFVTMPLDARRYQWSPEFPILIKVAGVAVVLLSFAFIIEVFRENTFAAPVVKIQEERHLWRRPAPDVSWRSLSFSWRTLTARLYLRLGDRSADDHFSCSQKRRRRKRASAAA